MVSVDQLQLGSYTQPGTPVISSKDPPGVTGLQARAGLVALWLVAQASQRFAYGKFEFEFFAAIVVLSVKLGRYPPGGISVLREASNLPQ